MDELELKDAIIREMKRSIKLLGAKSDLLAWCGSYGETMDDDEVLEGIRYWNDVTDGTESGGTYCCPSCNPVVAETVAQLVQPC